MLICIYSLSRGKPLQDWINSKSWWLLSHPGLDNDGDGDGDDDDYDHDDDDHDHDNDDDDFRGLEERGGVRGGSKDGWKSKQGDEEKGRRP